MPGRTRQDAANDVWRQNLGYIPPNLQSTWGFSNVPSGYGTPDAPGVGPGAPGGMGGLGMRLSPQALRATDRQFDMLANMYKVPGSDGGFMGGVGSTLKGLGGRLVNWAGKNPELALGIAGTAAEVYGAHKQGKREDREFEMMEEEVRRRREEDERRRRAQQAASERIVARRVV